jgi:hypothetical protein
MYGVAFQLVWFDDEAGDINGTISAPTTDGDREITANHQQTQALLSQGWNSAIAAATIRQRKLPATPAAGSWLVSDPR